jgi:hypothetical protein
MVFHKCNLTAQRISCAILWIAVLTQSGNAAQPCAYLNIQHRADIPSGCAQMTMTMREDLLGRPFLYVAQKEAGLRVYDITNIDARALVRTVPIDALDSLEVMNVTQDGNYLYLALGSSFFVGQNPGMAIVDVTAPASASATSVWKSSVPGGGGGIVKVEGHYAYFGAMKQGLILFDVADKHHMAFVSQFVPDTHYPDPNPDPNKFNARGMEVRNGIVYLCYDAGGLRIIDTADKLHPVEIGRFSNPTLNRKPRAYNNIVLDGSLAYIAADFCGLEILNVSDPGHITLTSWWNPWHCQVDPFGWFSSPGHANEIEYNKDCKLLFMSTGKSDLHVVDISNPAAPDSCNGYGGVSNGIGTWGLNLHQDRIFLSYVCASWPFPSNWTGVKILSYTPCPTSVSPAKWSDVKRLYR